MTGKFQSILLGALIVGLLATLLSLLQIGMQSQVLGSLACCAIPTIGGLMATWHYTSTNELTIRAGEGALIGLAACVLGYVVSLILSVAVSFTGLMPSPFDVDAIVEMAQDSMISRGSSQQEIDQVIGFTRNYYVAIVGAVILAYGIFGAVVGAIGANIFKHGAPETPAAE